MQRVTRWLTVGQAARRLGIAPNTLRTLTDVGRIRCERNDANHRIYNLVEIMKEQERRAEKRVRTGRAG